jgi:hypothetical protein
VKRKPPHFAHFLFVICLFYKESRAGKYKKDKKKTTTYMYDMHIPYKINKLQTKSVQSVGVYASLFKQS